jgi:hypothetical protein
MGGVAQALDAETRLDVQARRGPAQHYIRLRGSVIFLTDPWRLPGCLFL